MGAILHAVLGVAEGGRRGPRQPPPPATVSASVKTATQMPSPFCGVLKGMPDFLQRLLRWDCDAHMEGSKGWQGASRGWKAAAHMHSSLQTPACPGP